MHGAQRLKAFEQFRLGPAQRCTAVTQHAFRTIEDIQKASAFAFDTKYGRFDLGNAAVTSDGSATVAEPPAASCLRGVAGRLSCFGQEAR